MLEQKEFRGETVEAAQTTANEWWAGQTGLTRISEYMSPANLNEHTRFRWIATIIYEKTRTP
jgi:hypothetical protein